MPDSLLVGPQKLLIDKDPYIGFVKRRDNQIHVDNIPKNTNMFVEEKTISDTGESRASVKLDGVIFFLKRFMDQF